MGGYANTDNQQYEWSVHKFGGTSVGSADRYINVAKIVLDYLARGGAKERLVVVVSAMAGVTNALEKCILNPIKAYLLSFNVLSGCNMAGDAELNGENFTTPWAEVLENQVAKKHLDCLKELRQAGYLNDSTYLNQFETSMKQDVRKICEVLRVAVLIRECSIALRDIVMGFGEIWSAQILAAILNGPQGVRLQFPSAEQKVPWINARDFLFVNHVTIENVERTDVNWEISRSAMTEILTERGGCINVVTGFVATDEQGKRPTTLRRNGSDHSAAIVSGLLHAKFLIIWTDVDGVYSADPRYVKGTRPLTHISYAEAAELAFFGAKVLHPSTMAPCIQHNVPIYLKSSLDPTKKGTAIGPCPKHLQNSPPPSHGVRALTKMAGLALVNVEGRGLIGVVGIACRLFSCVKENQINVVMISQGCSEHSICFAVREGQATKCKQAIEDQFYREICVDDSMAVNIDMSCGAITVVGDYLHHSKGVLGLVATALGTAGVNIMAVAQGSSERNMTFIVQDDQLNHGLQALHDVVHPRMSTSFPLLPAAAALQKEIGNVTQVFLFTSNLDVTPKNKNFLQSFQDFTSLVKQQNRYELAGVTDGVTLRLLDSHGLLLGQKVELEFPSAPSVLMVNKTDLQSSAANKIRFTLRNNGGYVCWGDCLEPPNHLSSLLELHNRYE